MHIQNLKNKHGTFAVNQEIRTFRDKDTASLVQQFFSYRVLCAEIIVYDGDESDPDVYVSNEFANASATTNYYRNQFLNYGLSELHKRIANGDVFLVSSTTETFDLSGCDIIETYTLETQQQYLRRSPQPTRETR